MFIVSEESKNLWQSVGSLVPMAMKLFLANSTGSPFYKLGVQGSCVSPSRPRDQEGQWC